MSAQIRRFMYFPAFSDTRPVLTKPMVTVRSERDCQFCFTGIAVHAAVDVHADDIRTGRIDLFDGAAVMLPESAVKTGTQQTVHYPVIAFQAAGDKGVDRNFRFFAFAGIVGAVL